MLPSSRKLIAVAVGILLAGVPVGALNYWLDALIARQHASDAETFSRRSIDLAETRMGEGIRALETLARRGVDGCLPEQIADLKAANLSVAWVKQIAVLGADGGTLCSDLDLGDAPRPVVAARAIKDSLAVLEIVQLGDPPRRMVRLRRPAGTGGRSVAALLPTEVLFARLGLQNGNGGGYGGLSFLDGTLIDETGTKPTDAASLSAMRAGSRASDRFGIQAVTSRSQANGLSTLGDMRDIATVATGALALIILGFAFLLPWRQRDNPITELERALKAGEFVPYYQPMVDITNGHLRGAEVLMRWKKRDGTIVSPAVFIPLAESSGLIVDMTRSMMRQVTVDLGEACGLRPKIKLGFNMTAQHFADERIVRDLRTIFDRSPIRYSQIVLEVTERQPLENLTKARHVIATLQELGVRIAIDDVGTGHGGLSYMLKLGVDIIKIDKMFVDALGNDGHSTTIIETLVDLAHSMRMEVIAEGVETFEQVIALRERGIRTAQGFVFAPPLPAASFLRLIDAVDPRQRQAEPVRPVPLRYVSRRKPLSAA